jgi:hypothetical protein
MEQVVIVFSEYIEFAITGNKIDHPINIPPEAQARREIPRIPEHSVEQQGLMMQHNPGYVVFAGWALIHKSLNALVAP